MVVLFQSLKKAVRKMFFNFGEPIFYLDSKRYRAFSDDAWMSW
jgi:hypothetical protein